ncbi:hypothetical protein M2323_003043 [Rhodoblastus acidophilus]|nr:hypothetical protein [Rhodoblastus acidophilus]
MAHPSRTQALSKRHGGGRTKLKGHCKNATYAGTMNKA